MRRNLTFIGLLFLAVLTGCNNTTSEIGAGFVSSELFDISSVDSLSLSTSTALYDSLSIFPFSSGAARVLVGYHEDEKLGSVYSSSAFQISLPGAVTLDVHTTSYTALTLVFRRDTYSYYDTTQSMTINVHRLNKIPVVDQTSLSIYNTDSIYYDPTPIGTLTFSPRPHKKDSVEIVLPDDLGQQMMTMAQTLDPTFASNDLFKKFLKGFVLIPDRANTSCFMGFKNAPELRLYYHDNSFLPSQTPDRHIAFPSAAADIIQNKIGSDRRNTKLAPLKTIKLPLASSQTDNEIYMQGGTGLGMRVQIPYLKRLNLIQSKFQCTKAILKLQPISTTFYPQYNTPLPISLQLSVVDAENKLLAAYTGANLATDQLGNSAYNIDITSFINGQLAIEENNNNALFLRLPDKDYQSTVNRLEVGDQQNYNFTMRITVYYITLSDQ